MQLKNEPRYAARFTYAGIDFPSSSWLSASEYVLQFLQPRTPVSQSVGRPRLEA